MEVGDVIWIEPLMKRAHVGRVVEMSALEVVLEGAVQVHDHGSWQRFEVGDFEGDGQRAHVSRVEGRLTLPRLGAAHMLWPGDLDELRAWGDQ